MFAECLTAQQCFMTVMTVAMIATFFVDKAKGDAALWSTDEAVQVLTGQT
jgi:hypothetical protein